MIQNLMASLQLNELRLHQTGLDTAVIAKSVDKGTGLLELMASIGENDPMVFRGGVILTPLGRLPFVGKYVVCDALLDVIGFTREYHQ